MNQTSIDAFAQAHHALAERLTHARERSGEERLERLADVADAARRISDAVTDGFKDNEHLSPEESLAYGKSLRKSCPRSSHGSWEAPQDREDPIELLKSQAEDRVPELLPIRYERMAASPFAYFRGCALPMASDLSHTPITNLTVQACGDAHVSNFGIFATPERRLAFDINDFDETLPGPWEWDVKRLVASIEICARQRNFSKKQRDAAVLTAVKSYRESMRSFSKMGNLDVWYAYGDVALAQSALKDVLSDGSGKAMRKTIQKSEKKNSARAVRKFTEVVDGQLRVISDPPLIIPLREFDRASEFGLGDGRIASHLINHVIRDYRLSLPRERQKLIDSYNGVDIAHKVVGVGSVGLRAWIIVMEGSGSDDPLVLQAKEAQASVLERYVQKSRFKEHGRRVVEGQRAMQSTSDILLGWTRQMDDKGCWHDYYVRQLWDTKGSPDLDVIVPDALRDLARACGWALAHAHARTGDRFAIAGYLGSGESFDQALLHFARAYADQNEKDYEEFLDAWHGGMLQQASDR